MTADRILLASAHAIDSSNEARASYSKHLTRAGHAELLAAMDAVPVKTD
ncbi:MAG: hypothetical protein ACHQ5A_10860 [Opitutales bacterium]